MEQRYNKLNNINIDTNDDGIDNGIDNKLALSPISNKISVSILLTIINTLMSVSILVLVVYNVMPFINNIDQINLSDLQEFINQANNITNTEEYKKIINIIDIFDNVNINTTNKYITDIEKILNFSCSILPINCSINN
tara:strand:+ start:195 stop:608 length:414 start_codon:yes stop_codon:yes gene_type:complete